MNPNRIQIEVVYNGVTRPLDVNSNQRVVAVLKHAIKLFGITQAPHLLSLFREDGTRVEEDQSVEAAGLSCSVILLLRPDTVKGGAGA